MTVDLEIHERYGAAVALLEMLTEQPEPADDRWGRQTMVRLTVHDFTYRRVREFLAENDTRLRDARLNRDAAAAELVDDLVDADVAARNADEARAQL